MAGLGRRSHYRKHITDAILHDLPEPDESKGQRIARVVGTRGGNMFDVLVAPPSSSYPGGTKKALLAHVKDSAINTPFDYGIESDRKFFKDSTSTSGGGRGPCIGISDNEKTPSSSATRTAGEQEQQPTLLVKKDFSDEKRLIPQLAFLPTKFRKLVWIKRNDFVIVECGEDEQVEAQEKVRNKDSPTSKTGGGFRYVISHILYKNQVKHIKSKGLWPSNPFFEESDTSLSEGKQATRNSHGTTSVCRPYEDDSEIVEGRRLVSIPNICGDDDDVRENHHRDGAFDNGIVYEDPITDEFLINTNRIAALCVNDSSSEDSDDD